MATATRDMHSVYSLRALISQKMNNHVHNPQFHPAFVLGDLLLLRKKGKGVSWEQMSEKYLYLREVNTKKETHRDKMSTSCSMHGESNYEVVSESFRTESITEYIFTIINTR